MECQALCCELNVMISFYLLTILQNSITTHSQTRSLCLRGLPYFSPQTHGRCIEQSHSLYLGQRDFKACISPSFTAKGSVYLCVTTKAAGVWTSAEEAGPDCSTRVLVLYSLSHAIPSPPSALKLSFWLFSYLITLDFL